MSPTQKKILESARLALVALSVSATPVLAASDLPVSSPAAPVLARVQSQPQTAGKIQTGEKAQAVKKEEGGKVETPKAERHSALPSKLLLAENAAKTEPKAETKHEAVKKDEKKGEKKDEKTGAPVTGTVSK